MHGSTIKIILMYFAILFGAGDKPIADSKGKKVKFTLEQATKAQRGKSIDILLL